MATEGRTDPAGFSAAAGLVLAVSFAGALAVALTEKMDMISAVRFANCAGALATTRLGAQAAMPFRAEVEECLTSNLDMAEKTKSRMSRYT